MRKFVRIERENPKLHPISGISKETGIKSDEASHNSYPELKRYFIEIRTEVEKKRGSSIENRMISDVRGRSEQVGKLERK